ncbi:copper amine oxidase N-terminal domain-containing protein [Paenibacillus sp. N3/727]|uniref:copper amine oxidase N-terminal domain-containing protein n=1 Tax=Paenibacillus sp. N3/727 TaxID=2925845 RepID=UPI001F53B535|nr:copper amine oxidase N-terminal domain-containing protein [Paenibacillus sp. N3/727]UNK20144.1 copper amine oxidase N-terminal domain-containing protein [Paenibacillus sp. N3/727]
MRQKLKIVSAFLCGAIFFSGVSYAADNYLKAFPIKNSKIIINGSETVFDDPVVSINNRLYVPLKEFGQETGFSVSPGAIIQIEKFEKLPITITRDDVTITLNSLNKIDGKVQLNITIKNDSDKRVKVDLSRIRADDNIKGRKSYTTSASYFFTPINDNWSITTKRFLDELIDSNSEVTGTIQIASISKGTKNIHFYFESHSVPTSFPFYVDTEGLF